MQGSRLTMVDEGVRPEPGDRGFSAEVIARNRRERLFAALAEACAEHGYGAVTVADVVARAGLTEAAFEELFADKNELALAAHRELANRLLGAIDRACIEAGPWEARVRLGVRAAMQLLAADAPTAQLLTIEVLALGSPGSSRYGAAVGSFAARLRANERPHEPVSTHADWILLAGIAALVGRLVMAGEATALPLLEDEFVAVITAVS